MHNHTWLSNIKLMSALLRINTSTCPVCISMSITWDSHKEQMPLAGLGRACDCTFPARSLWGCYKSKTTHWVARGIAKKARVHAPSLGNTSFTWTLNTSLEITWDADILVSYQPYSPLAFTMGKACWKGWWRVSGSDLSYLPGLM